MSLEDSGIVLGDHAGLSQARGNADVCVYTASGSTVVTLHPVHVKMWSRGSFSGAWTLSLSLSVHSLLSLFLSHFCSLSLSSQMPSLLWGRRSVIYLLSGRKRRLDGRRQDGGLDSTTKKSCEICPTDQSDNCPVVQRQPAKSGSDPPSSLWHALVSSLRD